MIKPQNYETYRQYLNDWFWSQKAVNSKFSFRFVARHLGLRSPNHFHLVITGQRQLSSRVMDKFMRLAKLNSLERQFLKYQFLAETVQDLKKRIQYQSNAVLTRKRLKENQTHDETDLNMVGDILAWNIKMAAIYFRGFSRDSLIASVQRQSRFPVTSQAVESAVSTLETRGVLKFQNGRAEFDESAVLTKWDHDHASIKEHHKSNLKLAIETIQWPIDQRFLSSVTVAVNKDLKASILAEIRALFLSILERSEALTTAVTAVDESVQKSADNSGSNSAVQPNRGAANQGATNQGEFDVVTIQLALFPFFKQ